MTYEETLIYVMSTPRGRQFVWEILSRAKVFSTSFTTDPYLHAYSAGRKDQALPLYADCETYCPEQMALARKEAHDRSVNRKPDSGNPDSRPEAPRNIDTRPAVLQPGAEAGGLGGDYDPFGARQTADGAGGGEAEGGGKT